MTSLVSLHELSFAKVSGRLKDKLSDGLLIIDLI